MIVIQKTHKIEVSKYLVLYLGLTSNSVAYLDSDKASSGR